MTLFYAPNPFWGPPLWVIGPRCPFHAHLLRGLATRCAMSGAVLHGRGDLSKLVQLGGIICAGPRCLHMLWEFWRPLEWFWWYWGWSVWRRAPIRCEHVVPLVLDIPAKFQGNWSRRRRRVVVGIGGWVGGEVGACMLLLRWSGGPSLCCVRLLALSPCYVHICACCHTCGTSTI